MFRAEDFGVEMRWRWWLCVCVCYVVVYFVCGSLFMHELQLNAYVFMRCSVFVWLLN